MTISITDRSDLLNPTLRDLAERRLLFALSRFESRVEHVEMLTAQEERTAFLRLAELRQNDSQDAETLRHRIIESNLRLVFSIAKRYAQPKSDEFEFTESLLGDDGDEIRTLQRARLIRRHANRLMKKLDDRDRAIVMSQFGIDRSESGLAFRKIADEIGISTTRTVQLFHRSMKRMRQAAEELRIDHQIEAA